MSQARKGQNKVCTIWLEPEIGINGTDKMKMFYCFNCRIPILKYIGKVFSVIPGNAPYNPSTVLKCKGNVRYEQEGEWEECGMQYAFVAGVYTKNYQST